MPQGRQPLPPVSQTHLTYKTANTVPLDWGGRERERERVKFSVTYVPQKQRNRNMFKCPPSVGFALACVSSYTTPTCIYEDCLALYWKKWNLPTYITIPLSLLNGNVLK